MAPQASQARAPAVASSSSPVLAVHTNHDAPRRPRVIAVAAAAAEDEEDDYDLIGRALLTKRGFDPDDVNKKRGGGRYGWTPMMYFCWKGNINMVRYLISIRGADGRQTDRYVSFPLFWAAAGGLLEMVQFVYHHCSAPDDIRRLCHGCSPLRTALEYGHFEVAKWLLLKGALAPRDDVDGGGIDDEIMIRDLSPRYSTDARRNWGYDKREALLAWARNTVTDHENFQFLFMERVLFEDDTGKVLSSSSTPGIVDLMAHYVAGTPEHLHTLRQLLDRLEVYIDDVPFVEDEEEDE